MPGLRVFLNWRITCPGDRNRYVAKDEIHIMSLSDKIQRHPFVVLVSLVGAVASIVGVLATLRPQQSESLREISDILSQPWVALSVLAAFILSLIHI